MEIHRHAVVGVLMGGVLSATLAAAPSYVASYVAAHVRPPAIPREFRGAFVATVNNIDWPSQPGLSSVQQQAELTAILDRAAALHLNAILLQVRPAADAIYASRFEPWSEYLTGAMGRPPRPYYDPLAFAVTEAHKRGLELHAWFNPFRVRLPNASSPAAANHVSRTHPQWVLRYGGQQWLDPGQVEAQRYVLGVIMDVVRRYDIDGVILDDYFYPYPIKNRTGSQLNFPDQASWSTYRRRGGRLGLEDWRRDNVNRFVYSLQVNLRKIKPWVKFGISPFGIWRPGYPSQIKGFDAYARLYADARKWLVEGWVDYLAPQLYWDADAAGQSYPVLLNWWVRENLRNRHIWPANAVSRVRAGGRTVAEILKQIEITRRQSAAMGNILWNFKPLLENRLGLADALRRRLYTTQALVPACPWLDATPPARPKLEVFVSPGGSQVKLSWQPGPGEPPARWVVLTRTQDRWQWIVLPGQRRSYLPTTSQAPDAVALAALDRLWNISPYAVLEAQRPSKRLESPRFKSLRR